jgi:hypothetical protein
VSEITGETIDSTPGASITIPSNLLTGAQNAITQLVYDQELTEMDFPGGKVKRAKDGFLILLKDWR